MSEYQAHDLNELIRRIKEPSELRDHVCVVLDSAGNVVRNGVLSSVMGKLFAARTVYQVKIGKKVAIYNARRLLETFLTNERTDIEFRVELEVPPQEVERVVKALHDDNQSPADIVFALIMDTLRELMDESARMGPTSAYSRVMQNRDAWEREIARALKNRFGLLATIKFDGNYVEEALAISITDHKIYLRDLPERPCPISVDITLGPTADHARSSLPPTRDGRQRILRDIVTQAALTDVTYYQYVFDVASVEAAIRLRANRHLANYAYQVAGIQVRAPIQTLVRQEQVSVSVPWSGHRGREVHFHIDTLMTVVPDGAGRYDGLGQPDRKSWLEANGRAALRTAMHGRDFFDLSQAQQAAVERQVREILFEEARRIGHTIEPIVARVQLPENAWLERKVVDLGTGIYKTRNDMAEAEFGITLELQFQSIWPLVQFVDQRRPGMRGDYSKAIEDEIRAMVRQKAQLVMRDVEAQDYFAKWEEWSFEGDEQIVRGKTNYVRNLLIREIKRELERLSPEVCKVNLHRVDSRAAEIIKFLNGLVIVVSGEIKPAELRSHSQSRPYELTVSYSNIDPFDWPAVMQRGTGHLDLARIRQVVQQAADEFLFARNADELDNLNKGVRSGDKEEVTKRRMEEAISVRTREVFGFTIRLERAAVGLSVSTDAEYSQNSLGDLRRLNQAKVVEKGLEIDREAQIAASEFMNEQIQLLRKAIAGNRRTTEEDLARYDRDIKEMARLNTELARSGRLLGDLAGEAGRRAQLSASDPSEPPAEEPPADDDGKIIDGDTVRDEGDDDHPVI